MAHDLIWEAVTAFTMRNYNKCKLKDWEVQRAAVPGGWLVRVREYPGEPAGLTFMPDPDHTWDP